MFISSGNIKISHYSFSKEKIFGLGRHNLMKNTWIIGMLFVYFLIGWWLREFLSGLWFRNCWQICNEYIIDFIYRNPIRMFMVLENLVLLNI